MSIPTAPFTPVPLLMLEPPVESELYGLLCEAHRLVERDPAILEAVDADLDLHGQRKKVLRIADAQWTEAQSLSLPTMNWQPTPVAAESVRLDVGRPRTPAYVVYMFLIARAFFGGFKSAESTTLMVESMTLRVFLTNQGMRQPGRSTLTELVNAVTLATRDKILDAQLRLILNEGWDDGQTMLLDSTSVAGNVQWPTDSRLMVDLVARLWRRGGRLDAVGLPTFGNTRLAKVLGVMSKLDRDISLAPGGRERKRTRRRLYDKLLKKARRAVELLTPQVEQTERALATLDVLPSLRARAERMAHWLRSDLDNLAKVVRSCEARVLRGEKVPVTDKVLSVSDPSVGFIVKGGRDPVVGYKPQLARSGNGFVTGLIVPQGNASDSSQLVPMFEQVEQRTKVTPTTVSVDDGYSSRVGRATLQERGVEVMSISGSKGKRITPDVEWDSEVYAVARDDRSAVESLMFTIKHKFNFGRVARRGLDNVRAELLEKVVTYNFCRLFACRSRHAAQARQEQLAA